MNDEASPRSDFLIAVMAHDRPEALQRLLGSLSKLERTVSRFDLLISIDGGGDAACERLAREVDWSHGACEVRINPQQLGLKEHVEVTTDRVADYEAIIILEDDLSVSPWLLHYCEQAHAGLGACPDVAQISLYRHGITYSRMPFTPVNDGHDVWFSRVPSSWGQMVSREAWQTYREWARQHPQEKISERLPPCVLDWQHTWLRDFFNYISLRRLWVAYPHQSLTTNHGDQGVNYRQEVHDLQMPLEVTRRDYRLCRPENSQSRYDEWLEPYAECLGLTLPAGAEAEVDLRGEKSLESMGGKLVLSTRPCRDPKASFGVELVPLEMNVRLHRAAVSDDCISLGRAEDFEAESHLAGTLAAEQLPLGLVAEFRKRWHAARKKRGLRGLLRRLSGRS